MSTYIKIAIGVLVLCFALAFGIRSLMHMATEVQVKKAVVTELKKAVPKVVPQDAPWYDVTKWWSSKPEDKADKVDDIEVRPDLSAPTVQSGEDDKGWFWWMPSLSLPSFSSQPDDGKPWVDKSGGGSMSCRETRDGIVCPDKP
jgi:hypothetical protein